MTSLDGKVYELDEATLAQSRIPDDEVAKLGLMPPLPPPPAVPEARRQNMVSVRPGPNGSTVIDITPDLGGA